MNATILIPARLASMRLPRKVLLAQTGRPMIQHVADNAARARCATQVIVAADDPIISAALAPFGTRVLLTRADHPNGTSRLSEAATLLGLPDDALVVNAQGDEPEMDPRVIDAAAGALLGTPGADIGTCCARFGPGEDPANPNIVKVVTDLRGRALYFSRALIPHDRDRTGAAPPLRHVGVYAYRAGFLRRYAQMPATPLERSEQLEQLRALEHGCVIAVAPVEPSWLGGGGIDTSEQYEAFVRRHGSRG